jgi:hypothetical protein
VRVIECLSLRPVLAKLANHRRAPRKQRVEDFCSIGAPSGPRRSRELRGPSPGLSRSSDGRAGEGPEYRQSRHGRGQTRRESCAFCCKTHDAWVRVQDHRDRARAIERQNPHPHVTALANKPQEPRHAALSRNRTGEGKFTFSQPGADCFFSGCGASAFNNGRISPTIFSTSLSKPSLILSAKR